MKTFSLDEATSICMDLFNKYIEPTAYSMMSGELPSITVMIHRTESKDHDWTAQIRLKNSLTISVFRCEVYIQDILLLCRRCNMHLQTVDVFRPMALFYMLHGLFQQQHMNFSRNTDRDYDSMITGASKSTYEFIKDHYPFENDLERIVLDIMWYNSMVLTNTYKYAPKNKRVGDILDNLHDEYVTWMKLYHYKAFAMARTYKSYTNQIDEDGFIVLERKTNGSTSYSGKNNIAHKDDDDTNPMLIPRIM